jgi:hypothetical protein
MQSGRKFRRLWGAALTADPLLFYHASYLKFSRHFLAMLSVFSEDNLNTHSEIFILFYFRVSMFLYVDSSQENM